MIEKTLFIPIENSYIPAILTLPEDTKSYPLIIMIHGLLSCKSGDGFIFPKICEALSKKNVATLRIDSCSCGESRRSRKLYKVSTLIEELKQTYNYIKKHPNVNPNKIGFLGHSLGGLVTFNCLDLNPKCLITLNGAMSKDYTKTYDINNNYLLDEDGDRYLLQKQSDGRIEILYEDFYKDIIKYQNEYEYHGNYLMCVSDLDPHISMEMNNSFYQKLKCENKTMIISNSNHTFNAKTGNYEKLYELIDKMIPWLKENLCI